MKNTLQVTYFLISLLLLSFISSPVLAQKKKSSQKTKKITNSVPKITDARLIPPAIREFNHSYEVESKYDKSKNETTISLDMPLAGKNNDLFTPTPLSILVNFSYKGQKLKAFPTKIFFLITKNVWKQILDAFPKPDNPSQLIISADNDRLKYSVLTRREIESLPFSNDFYYSDNFALLLSYKNFLRIVNSEKVSLNVSYLDNLELKENHLEALRDFATFTDPFPKYATSPVK